MATAPAAVDLNLVLESLRSQLTLRTNELLNCRASFLTVEARLAASESSKTDIERQNKEMLEIHGKLSKERESALLAELALRDTEILRLRDLVAQSVETSLQVERECEEKLKAKTNQLNAMRSRCDDIADNFAEMLQALLTKMQKVVPLVVATTAAEGGGGGGAAKDGEGIGEGLQVASAQLLVNMSREVENLKQ